MNNPGTLPPSEDVSPQTDDQQWMGETPRNEADEAASTWDPFIARMTSVR